MDEVFESREILPSAELAVLARRNNHRSAMRLGIHLATIVALVALATSVAQPIVAVCSTIVLAAVVAAMFAPFHECAHSTAFANRRLNTAASWIAASFFGMSPTYYRDFHFAHHRHTQDPVRDPEVASDPELMLDWPQTYGRWFMVVGGWRLGRGKLRMMWSAWLAPERIHRQVRGYARQDRIAAMVGETRVLMLIWLAVLAAALGQVPGAVPLATALLVSHLFQSLWLSTEHTGRATHGTILARTRSTLTWPWVRFYLWNMNFHSEHHAWPAIPWHRLPTLHDRVAAHIDPAPSYLATHVGVLGRLGRRSGSP